VEFRLFSVNEIRGLLFLIWEQAEGYDWFSLLHDSGFVFSEIPSVRIGLGP
jgi:hypothetical protein